MAKRKSAAAVLSEVDGRQLAIDMLREIGNRWKNNDDLEGVAEVGIRSALLSREPDIMRRYLTTLRRNRSSALETGFLCLLTEFIGCEPDEALSEALYFEHHEDTK